MGMNPPVEMGGDTLLYRPITVAVKCVRCVNGDFQCVIKNKPAKLHVADKNADIPGLQAHIPHRELERPMRYARGTTCYSTVPKSLFFSSLHETNIQTSNGNEHEGLLHLTRMCILTQK